MRTKNQAKLGRKSAARTKIIAGTKIVAILFSKVQCSRGKRVRDLKRHYFAPIRWVSHQKVDRTRLRPDRRRSL
jgi:hypothetical protein